MTNAREHRERARDYWVPWLLGAAMGALVANLVWVASTYGWGNW